MCLLTVCTALCHLLIKPFVASYECRSERRIEYTCHSKISVLFLMFEKPIEDAAKNIPIKRKRASVWPFATRQTLESAISSLIEQGRIRELSPRIVGESIPPPRLVVPAFNTSALHGAPTTLDTRLPSRSDTMPKTLPGTLEALDLRGAMYPASTPTSQFISIHPQSEVEIQVHLGLPVVERLLAQPPAMD